MGCSFFSTVTPAQLPTFSFRPVRALYMVVLPEFGLPVKAMRMGIFLLFLMFSILQHTSVAIR